MDFLDILYGTASHSGSGRGQQPNNSNNGGERMSTALRVPHTASGPHPTLNLTLILTTLTNHYTTLSPPPPPPP